MSHISFFHNRKASCDGCYGCNHCPYSMTPEGAVGGLPTAATGCGDGLPLDQLPVGASASICMVAGQGALRRRLLDMGLTPGTTVTIQKRAPMGDPIEIHLRNYELSLRIDEARQVTVHTAVSAVSKAANGKAAQNTFSAGTDAGPTREAVK